MSTRWFVAIVACICFLLTGCMTHRDNSLSTLDSSERITGTVLSKGTKLNYYVEGEGYPCIVVNEGGEFSKAISKELKKHFKFIFLYARMNIVDPGKIDKITFDLLTEDVDHVRSSLNLETVGVFGHSICGLIALEYARKYPQHTSFVIINGTPPYENKHLYEVIDSYWATNASEDRKNALLKKWEGISRESLNRLGTSDAGKLEYILDGPKCWYNYNYDATPLLKDTYWNMDVWNRIFSDLMPDYDLGQDKLIQVPVFLSLGKYDFLTPWIVWEDQKAKIPNLSVNLFEHSGHWSFYEEEELFRKKVIAWIEKIKVTK
jgi:proline iminopeptidase